MLKLNSELRSEARQALQGNWAMAAVAALVYVGISGVCNYIPFVGWLLSLLVALPISWGMAMLFYNVRQGRSVDIGVMFNCFQDYGRILGTKLLQSIYIFLWTLLLVVPGIIKSCSYAMTDYILRDHPELAYNAAIEKSMAMMEGHKMQYFLLQLSFIGWALLCILSLGIGYFFLIPYISTSVAAFYESLKTEQAGAAAFEGTQAM